MGCEDLRDSSTVREPKKARLSVRLALCAWFAWSGLAVPPAAARSVDAIEDGDQALVAAAEQSAISGRPIQLREVLRVRRPLRLAADIVFGEGGGIETVEGGAVVLAGRVSAPAQAQIFRGQRNVELSAANWVSVAWWGAGSDRDAAPAFRRALGSNRTIYVPPGEYVLGSVVPAPCCAFNGPMILGTNLENVHVEAHGATLSVAETQGYSTILHFDRSRKISLAGGTFVGSRVGMKPDAENVALTFSSVVNLDVREVDIRGNFGGNGAGVAGDWIVNAHFEDIRMERVGMCFDIAFVQDVTVNRLTATGADHEGKSGPGQSGMKCISNIYDTPNLQSNGTGVAFGTTERLTVANSTIRNFRFGTWITTGNDFLFVGNRFEVATSAATDISAAHYIIAANTPAVQGYRVEGDQIAARGPNSYGVFISTAKNNGSETNVIRGVSIRETSVEAPGGVAIDADSRDSLGPVTYRQNRYSGPKAAVGPTIRPLVSE